jgi:hypothetical protein
MEQHGAAYDALTPVHLADRLEPLRRYVATWLDATKTPRQLDELDLSATKPYPDRDGYVWFRHRDQGYDIAIRFDQYHRFRGFKEREMRIVCRHPDGQPYVVHADHRGHVIGATPAKVAPEILERLPMAKQ